uniref:Vesicle transport protein USE1 n=1 Tax=Phallusia mammillata TaxID=59560 RepID=A0A6F9DWX1_9ASCI|nr:vesicle transport protein USE1-like [Phallusia mammillata]
MPPISDNPVEADLLRIFRKCEDIMSKYSENQEQRMKSYIQALEDKIVDLKETEDRIPDETMDKYQSKISDFKDFLMAKTTSLKIESKVSQTNQASDDFNKMHMQEKAQKQVDSFSKSREMKKELFWKSTNASPDTELRHRPVEGRTASQEIEENIAHQHEKHEQLANEMVKLARHLKDNTQIAGKIIKEDMKVLEESTRKTDKNLGQLKHESTRLEAHLQKGTNWWLWIALAVVCATFMCMIVFIRFFPKPR